MSVCIRGCIQPRKHVIELDEVVEVVEHDPACRGCLGEKAEHGQLCYSCHALLLDALTHAPGQVALLHAVQEPSSQQALTVETKSIRTGPRLESTGPDYIGLAKGAPAAGASEPIRLAAIDAARDIEDVLSQWVEQLCADYQISGPPLLASTAGREDGRRLRWLPVNDDGTPRSKYDPVTVHRGDGRQEVGQYVLVDPPARFDVDSAAPWLRSHLLRLESQEGIGDEMEALSAVMAQAHSVAPWRQQSTPLRGIPCPGCHRMSLTLYGGMTDVTCTSCNKRYAWARYAVWVRMYLEESREKEGA